MAANQVDKRRTLARTMFQRSAALMDILYSLEEFSAQYNSAGLLFTDEDFEGVAGVQHMSAADASNLIGSITALGKFIRGDVSALTGSHITNFEKARP